MWPFKRTPKSPKKEIKTASDDDIRYARQVIDKAFEPVLRRNIEALNEILAERGVQIGADFKWLIWKVGPEKESEGKKA